MKRLTYSIFLLVAAPMGAFAILVAGSLIALGFGIAVVIEAFSGSKFERRGRI